LIFMTVSDHLSYAQKFQPYIDSLNSVINTAEEREKIIAYIKLSYYYNAIIEPELELKSAKEARALSIEANWPEAEAYTLQLLGDVYGDLNHQDSAIFFSKNAITLSNAVADTHLLIYSFLDLSEHFMRLELPDSSLFYAIIATKLGGKYSGKKSFSLEIPGLTDTISLAEVSAYGRLAEIYRTSGNPDLVVLYRNKSIRFYDSIHDTYREFQTLRLLANDYKFFKQHKPELEALLTAYNIALEDSTQYFWQAQIASGIGYWYMLHGSYIKAIDYFKIAKSGFLKSYRQSSIPKHYYFYAKQSGNIARSYMHWGKLDSALKYHHIALKLFNTSENKTKIDIANQIESIGLVLIRQGKYDSAINLLLESKQIRKDINDWLGVGMCLDGLGEIFRLQGRYDTAISILNESIKTKISAELSTKDPFPTYFQQESLSVTYLQLGHVFYNWGKYENALSYYDTSINICRDIGYVRGEVEAHQAIAEVFIQTSQTQPAIQQLQEALKLARQIANKPLEALVMQGMASVFKKLNQPDSALQYYNSSIEVLEGHKYLNDLPDILLQSGLLHLQLRQLGEAYDDLNRSIALAKKSGQTKTLMEASKVLSGIYFNAADYKRAYEYLDVYTRLKDSVFQIETHQQLAEMQAKHQTQQKQQQIELLENKNSLNELQIRQSRYVNFSLGGLILFITLFAVLFLRQIKIQNEQKALIFQQQLLRSQMNPHFIFNSLTNIQNFIFKNDSLSAGKYLSSFAKLMRNILDNSREERIPLERELETLKQYLDLQKLRMGHKLEYEVIVDERINTNTVIVPPMLAQPFIENAIEHGIMHKEGAGKVSIRMDLANDILEFTIEDNGVGREKAREIEKVKGKTHRSLAMKITRERLEAIRKKTRRNTKFEIIDLVDEDGRSTGTRVVFGIPVRS